MMNKCLTDGCSNNEAPALERGVCMKCYVRAKRMVESGVTTWLELSDLGMVLPNSKEGGDKFTEAFKRAKGHK